MGNFLILFKDEVTSCLLAKTIEKVVPDNSVFRAASTYQAMQVLENIARAGELAESELQKEAHILLELDLPFLEAFVFLNELYQTRFPFPIRVYLFEDPDEVNVYRPDISRFRGMKWIKKGPVSQTVEQVVGNHSADYFQHDKKAQFPLYV